MGIFSFNDALIKYDLRVEFNLSLLINQREIGARYIFSTYLLL